MKISYKVFMEQWSNEISCGRDITGDEYETELNKNGIFVLEIGEYADADVRWRSIARMPVWESNPTLALNIIVGGLKP